MLLVPSREPIGRFTAVVISMPPPRRRKVPARSFSRSNKAPIRNAVLGIAIPRRSGRPGSDVARPVFYDETVLAGNAAHNRFRDTPDARFDRITMIHLNRDTQDGTAPIQTNWRVVRLAASRIDARRTLDDHLTMAPGNRHMALTVARADSHRFPYAA